MRITITDRLVRNRVNEGSACSFIASFFDDSSTSTDVWAAQTPTNARYRIDRVNGRPDCWQTVLDWVSLTPATTNTIAVTGAQNAIQSNCNYSEVHQLTVEANASLGTQYQQTHSYVVVNLAGQTT